MVFKPGIQTQLKEGNLQTLNMPSATMIRVEASPTWFQDNPTAAVQRLVDAIVFSRYGDLAQFVASSRQMRELGGMTGQRTFRNWDDLRADFSYNFGVEMLLITVLPQNIRVGGQPKVTVGNTFDIKWNFIAFPYPGMTQGNGTLVPATLQYNGVQYVYDPGFSPSAPGPTSRTDAATGVIKCAAPVMPPDLDKMLISVIGSGTETAAQKAEELLSSQIKSRVTPTIDQTTLDTSDKFVGYTPDLYTVNLGASAVVTTPLSGLQYWEVQIVALPRGHVPDPFNVPLPIVHETGDDGGVVSGSEWDGTLTTSPIETYGANGTDWVWDATLDTFLTPAIGVCPGYFLPDDQLPGSATAKPKLFNDYGRLLGMDQAMDVVAGKLYDRARSVYVVAVSMNNAAVITHAWQQGYWYTTGVASDGSYVAPTHVETDSFVAEPPPGGTAWPNVNKNYLTNKVANSGGIYQGASGVSGEVGVVGGMITQILQDTQLADCFGGKPYTTISSTTTYGSPIAPETPTSIYSPAKGPPAGSSGVAFVSTSAWVPGGVVATLSGGETHQYFTQTNTWGTNPPNTYFEWSGQLWRCIAIDGSVDVQHASITTTYTYHHTPGAYLSPVTNACVFGELGELYQPLPPVDPNWADSGHAGPQPLTDTFWTSLYTSGYHTPAFIGRMDSVYHAQYYEGDGSDSSIFNLSTYTGGGAPPAVNTGCYTGVDLGPLVNGDTVMVATDATKGYIWFGKNGQWYGQDGPLSPTSDGPQFGTKWAAVMDGATKSAFPITTLPGAWDRATAQPQYFPCASYRLGPGEVKIVFDAGALKYQPPSGFKVYGQS